MEYSSTDLPVGMAMETNARLSTNEMTEAQTRLQRWLKQSNRWLYNLLVLLDMHRLNALLMFAIGFSIRANPHNPMLEWIELRDGYGPVLWEALFLVCGLALWSGYARGLLGIVFVSPLIFMFWYAAQYVMTPLAQTRGLETPFFTMSLALAALAMVLINYMRNYVLQVIRAENVRLEAENKRLKLALETFDAAIPAADE